MAESLADDPKVLGVFKYTLEKNFDVFDAPDLPSLVLSLIVDRIPYELWSGIIVHNRLDNFAGSMVEAELRMRNFDAVVAEPLEFIPLLFIFWVLHVGALHSGPNCAAKYPGEMALSFLLRLQFQVIKDFRIHLSEPLVRHGLILLDFLKPSLLLVLKVGLSNSDFIVALQVLPFHIRMNLLML